jgi:alpha-beta hydrolase superfamily lysophospholipase
MATIEQHKLVIGSEGATLSATLALAGRAAPLLVLVHGFAGNKNESGLFTEAARYFGENGFSVLRFDFRGCGENSGSFKRVRLHDLIADLRSVFEYIKSDPHLEPLPLGFIGFSLGAGLGVLANPPVDSYVFWSPAIYTKTDMVPRYRPELESRGFVIKGSIKVSKEFIHDLDSEAIPHSLRAVRAPVLIVHGTGDQRIPYKSSEKAIRALRNAPAKADIILIPGADHSFRNQPYSRQRLLSESLTWLQRGLLDVTFTETQVLDKIDYPGSFGHPHTPERSSPQPA